MAKLFKCPMCRGKLIVDVSLKNNTTKTYCKRCNTSIITEFKNLNCSTKDMMFIGSLDYKENFSRMC